MTPTPRTKLLMAVLATGLLAVGAFAVGVEAKPGDGRPDPAAEKDARYHEMCDHPANATVQKRCDEYAARQQAMQDRKDIKQDRKDLREDRKELRDELKEKCKDAEANSTLAQRCEHLKDAVKARRVAHALLTAIRVHELELGRVEFRIHEVEAKLAGGNLTGNQTAALEHRLDKLNERHDRLIEKIADEKAKLQRLHDKWAEVADHLRDRKEKGEDDGGVDDADTDTSSTDSDA
jgi:hypothetical protein